MTEVPYVEYEFAVGFFFFFPQTPLFFLNIHHLKDITEHIIDSGCLTNAAM